MMKPLILSAATTTPAVMVVLLMRTVFRVGLSKQAVMVEPVPHLNCVRPMGLLFTAGLHIEYLLLFEGPLDLLLWFLWVTVLMTLFGCVIYLSIPNS
jgi:hypothetical protein